MAWLRERDVCQEAFPAGLRWCWTSFAQVFDGSWMPLAMYFVLTNAVSLLHARYVINSHPGVSRGGKPAAWQLCYFWQESALPLEPQQIKACVHLQQDLCDPQCLRSKQVGRRDHSLPRAGGATFLGQPACISEGCQVGAGCPGICRTPLVHTSRSRAEGKQGEWLLVF